MSKNQFKARPLPKYVCFIVKNFNVISVFLQYLRPSTKVNYCVPDRKKHFVSAVCYFYGYYELYCFIKIWLSLTIKTIHRKSLKEIEEEEHIREELKKINENQFKATKLNTRIFKEVCLI